ncbi:MAG TPA: helix-turn-helix transcriptional regulator, partial [Longimicrobiales bacterium]|nr:helix-turn-helix transcriptional regulator [Longimicrobiales bacterium]
GGHLRIEPANLYRRIRRLTADGLVEEAEERPVAASDQERRRYYRLTELGRRVVAEEAARMRALVEEAEARRILPHPAGPA